MKRIIAPLIGIALWVCSAPQVFAGAARLYVATDKEYYSPGETVGFQLFLTGSANINNSVYVEVLNCNGDILQKKVLPLRAGTSWGNIPVPESTTGGFLILYCFVMNDKNLEAECTKKISLQETGLLADTASAKKLVLDFFTEGNTWVAGMPNQLLIRCVNSGGRAVSAFCKIIDERNTVIETFTTDENGYARIGIEPENKKIYFIHAEEKATGAAIKKKLPALKESGVSLSVNTRPDSISYTLYSFTTDNNLLNYTLYILSKERVIYKSDISFQSTLSVVKESIALKDLAPGFLTLRLTDAKNNIAAQRIIYTPAGTGTMLTIIDTISGKSARVELPAYVSGLSYVNIRANNPLTSNAGLTQAVLQAGDQPIVSNSAGDANRLNDWLISAANGSPAPVTKASTVSPFLSLTGIAYNKYKKPLRDEKLNLIFVHSNQRKEYLVTKTDKNGKFSADGLVFYDTVSVYYQLADHSEERNEITVELNVSPDLSVTANEARAAQLACTVASSMPDTTETTKNNASSEPPRKDQKTLKEVSVKTYKAPPKTDTQKFIEENVSGQHNQAAFLRDEIDLIAHPQTIDTRPLFEFLRGRMASVQVTINSRGEVKLNTTGGAPIGVYLDDMEVTQDLDMVTNLRVSDVALVRYYGMPLKPRLEGTKTKFSGFFGTGNGGGGGDLMIYTKKGFVATEQMTRGLSRIRITGYSTDMPVKTTVPAPGSARTVFWKPNWQIAGPQTIFIGLSADDLKNTSLLIEGLNNDLDLFSFRKNLVFN